MKGVRTREGTLELLEGGGRIVVDEAAVIARVRAGEAEAYAELVRAHTNVALRAAVAFGAGADAEDVVQCAFLKAYQSLERFRDGAAFRPWLLRIVVNETRNTVRSAVRLRALAGREALLVGSEPLIPESADPAVAAVAEERRTLLRAALDELSEQQRQVGPGRRRCELSARLGANAERAQGQGQGAGSGTEQGTEQQRAAVAAGDGSTDWWWAIPGLAAGAVLALVLRPLASRLPRPPFRRDGGEPEAGPRQQLLDT